MYPEKFIHIARQLLSFGWIGSLGFLVDALVFTLVDIAIGNPYVTRLLSYFAAASFTWYLNRRFTFGPSQRALHEEWFGFIAVQSGGGIINYAVFAWLITAFSLFASMPVLAIAFGAIVGMGVNFTTAKYLIFERQNKDSEDKQ